MNITFYNFDIIFKSDNYFCIFSFLHVRSIHYNFDIIRLLCKYNLYDSVLITVYAHLHNLNYILLISATNFGNLLKYSYVKWFWFLQLISLWKLLTFSHPDIIGFVRNQMFVLISSRNGYVLYSNVLIHVNFKNLKLHPIKMIHLLILQDPFAVLEFSIFSWGAKLPLTFGVEVQLLQVEGQFSGAPIIWLSWFWVHKSQSEFCISFLRGIAVNYILSRKLRCNTRKFQVCPFVVCSEIESYRVCQ